MISEKSCTGLFIFYCYITVHEDLKKKKKWTGGRHSLGWLAFGKSVSISSNKWLGFPSFKCVTVWRHFNFHPITFRPKERKRDPCRRYGFRVVAEKITTAAATTTTTKKGEQVLLCVHCRVTGYVRVLKFVPPVYWGRRRHRRLANINIHLYMTGKILNYHGLCVIFFVVGVLLILRSRLEEGFPTTQTQRQWILRFYRATQQNAVGENKN